jgi:hypothetical protein
MRDLDSKSDALAALYHILLLKEIGIDASTVHIALFQGGQAFKVRTSLAAVGLAIKPSGA